MNTPGFWLFAVVAPVSLWLIAAWVRAMIYLLGYILANAWNRSREAFILAELRRGRRALQILQATCITAHSRLGDVFSASPLDALIKNKSALATRSTWKGVRMRHSRLPVSPDVSVADFLSRTFSELIPALAVSLHQYPDDQPVTLLFEADTSLPEQQVRSLWRYAWKTYGIRQQTEDIDSHGLAMVDRWLDHRIREKSLLLVVALQVAPENPQDTGETVVALLLGNRLTQNILAPRALLHRPEQNESQSLDENIAQALDWGPVQPDELHHLWQAGLSYKQQSAIAALNGRSPLEGVEMNSNLYDLDNTLGHTGCAAPWLAIAAAAQAVEQMQAPHLIVSGERNTDLVWSTLVSPYAPRKEMC
ncbi:hypothetical protein SM003_004193 [Cronobacter malonaticus]|nr:hypothetical protein [Cronobacter malonaticus]